MARLSIQQALQQARRAGFDPAQALVIVAIAFAESSGLQTDVAGPTTNTGPGGGPDRHRGLLQFSSAWHPEVSDACATDPTGACQFQAAYRVTHGTDFHEWETFTVPSSHPNSYLHALNNVEAIGSADPQFGSINRGELDKLTGGFGSRTPASAGIAASTAPQGGGLVPWLTASTQGGELTVSGSPFDVFKPISDAFAKLAQQSLWMRVGAGLGGAVLLLGAVGILVLPDTPQARELNAAKGAAGGQAEPSEQSSNGARGLLGGRRRAVEAA